jgi:hypothetical protein
VCPSIRGKVRYKYVSSIGNLRAFEGEILRTLLYRERRGMRYLILIISLLIASAPLFALEKNRTNDTRVFTEDDLEKYQYPSDVNESDNDLNIQSESSVTQATDGKETGKESAGKPVSVDEKKRPYSDIKAILYMTSW